MKRAMATKRAMVTATRVAYFKEGDGGDGKGVGQDTAIATKRTMATAMRMASRAMVTKRAMATATRVAGDDKGKGGKGDGNGKTISFPNGTHHMCPLKSQPLSLQRWS